MKSLNQEEKERLTALKEHIGPMAPTELRQSAEVHREFDPRSQFADQMDDYADLLKREQL